MAPSLQQSFFDRNCGTKRVSRNRPAKKVDAFDANKNKPIEKEKTMSFNGIEITEINVHPVKNRQPNSPLEAFVRVVLNEQFVINSIKVVKGKFGPFVSFPREYNKKEGKGYNLCFPLTKALQEHMSEKILGQYRMAMEV
jgi:stage V sporulation protein G